MVRQAPCSGLQRHVNSSRVSLTHLWRLLEHDVGDRELEQACHPHGEHHICDALLPALPGRQRIRNDGRRRRGPAQRRNEHQGQVANIAWKHTKCAVSCCQPLSCAPCTSQQDSALKVPQQAALPDAAVHMMCGRRRFGALSR